MEWKFLLVLAILLIVYLSAGSYLFQHLEGTLAETLQEEGNVTVGGPGLPDNFTQALRARYPYLSEEDLPGLVDMVVSAYTHGTIPTNITTNHSGTTWDLSTSFFFVCTVVTTIGYGNVAPTTVAGRVATIFYGLIGIPLCLVFLAGLGEKLLGCFKMVERLCGHLCCRCEKTCHVIRVFTWISVGWVLFLMIPAVIFTHMEGWEYLNGVYFCFVTLSTIGFGDLVAHAQDGNHKELYRVLTVVWVYVGLAWLSSLIALMSEILQKTIDEGGTHVQQHITHGVHHIASHVSSKVHHHDVEDHGADNGTKDISQTDKHGKDAVVGGQEDGDLTSHTDTEKPEPQTQTEGKISVL